MRCFRCGGTHGRSMTHAEGGGCRGACGSASSQSIQEVVCLHQSHAIVESSRLGSEESKARKGCWTMRPVARRRLAGNCRYCIATPTGPIRALGKTDEAYLPWTARGDEERDEEEEEGGRALKPPLFHRSISALGHRRRGRNSSDERAMMGPRCCCCRLVHLQKPMCAPPSSASAGLPDDKCRFTH